jgi:hypothetical protein
MPISLRCTYPRYWKYPRPRCTHGQYIREEKRRTVEAFIDLVKKDMAQGILPAKNAIDARMYLADMVGGSL